MNFNSLSILEKILGSASLLLITTVVVFVTRYYGHVENFDSYKVQVNEKIESLEAGLDKQLERIHDLELELKGVSVTIGHISTSSLPSTRIVTVPTSPSSEIQFKDLKINAVKGEK